MLRVLIVLMVMTGVAHADAPSGYKCGAGKANPGVGCTCPAGFADKRNSENHAICEKAAVTVPPCRKAGIAIKNFIAQDGDMKKIAGDKQQAFLKEVAAIVERRCLRDKWKGDLISCFTQKNEEKEIEACAKSHLTKEQNQAIEEEFDIVEKKFRNSETPAPAEPPPASKGDGGRVVVKEGSIQILDQVFFQSAKATIQPVSFPLLDNVAQVLKEHPEIQLVSVVGHTDNQGDDKANLKLSQDRAGAVVAYLVKRGIDAKRLDAKGFGETRPLASNDKPEGRAQNRRIEFVIMKKQ